MTDKDKAVKSEKETARREQQERDPKGRSGAGGKKTGTTTEDMVHRQGEDSSHEPES